VQCSVVQFCAMQCSAVHTTKYSTQCSTVQYSTVQYSTVQFNNSSHFFIAFLIVVLYISVILGMYIFTSILGYGVYGDEVSTNILLDLPKSYYRDVILGLYIVHMLFAFVVYINPAIQDIEDYVKVPKSSKYI
jgi:hypothetical protein